MYLPKKYLTEMLHLEFEKNLIKNNFISVFRKSLYILHLILYIFHLPNSLHLTSTKKHYHLSYLSKQRRISLMWYWWKSSYIYPNSTLRTYLKSIGFIVTLTCWVQTLKAPFTQFFKSNYTCCENTFSPLTCSKLFNDSAV